jgi:hypothetical protein
MDNIQTGTGSVEIKLKPNKKSASPKGVSFDGKVSDIEAPKEKDAGNNSVSVTMSGNHSSNQEWEEFLRQESKFDNALKILESATLSNHGSGEYTYGTGSRSLQVMEYLPMWMRFDEQSRLRREFVNEMRLLSRLR